MLSASCWLDSDASQGRARPRLPQPGKEPRRPHAACPLTANLPLLLVIISFPPMCSVTHLGFAHHTALRDLHLPLYANRAQVPVWVFHPSPLYRGHTFLTQRDSRAADTGSLDPLAPLLGAKCPLLTGSPYLGPEKTHLKATKSSLTPCHLPWASVLPLSSHPFPFKVLSPKAKWEGHTSAHSPCLFTSCHVPGQPLIPSGPSSLFSNISLVKKLFLFLPFSTCQEPPSILSFGPQNTYLPAYVST